MTNKNPGKNWPSQGLDQLGPKYYKTVSPKLPQPKKLNWSIRERSNRSTKARNVKITLPGERDV